MLHDIFQQLQSEYVVLHPVCFFSVAIQGEPKQDDIIYAKPKQLSAVDRDADEAYYLLSNIYSYIRQLECDVEIACNEQIVHSVMENIAWIELYMKLAKQSYEKTKQNQHLWQFYKENVEHLLSQQKNLGKVAVELSEKLCEKNNCAGSGNLWPAYKASQKAVQEAYKSLLEEREKGKRKG